MAFIAASGTVLTVGWQSLNTFVDLVSANKV